MNKHTIKCGDQVQAICHNVTVSLLQMLNAKYVIMKLIVCWCRTATSQRGNDEHIFIVHGLLNEFHRVYSACLNTNHLTVS